MPMPKNAAAPKEIKVEQTFTPYHEDQEEELARETASPMQLVVPQKPVTWDYQPTAEDLTIPRVMLLQGNSTYVLDSDGKIPAGSWMFPNGQTATRFTCTVLGMRRSRVRSTKPEPNSQERPIMLCMAPDAIQGYGNPGLLCKECPYSQWGEKDPATGKGTPPECRLRYHYLVDHDGDRAELMLNTTTKASKQAATTLTEGIARYGSGGTFLATITRKLETSGSNKFFVPVVVSIERIPEEEEVEELPFDSE